MTLSRTITGYSASPTRYPLNIQGEVAFVRCGADILLNGMRSDLAGEARCLVCDEVIRLQVSAGRVREMEPSEALLYVVEVESGGGTICVECEGSNLFNSQECLNRWLLTYPGHSGRVYRPQDYLDHCGKMGCSDSCPQ